MDKSNLRQFLDQYSIPESNGFILGIFQPGVTVYNQQLRSLNIIHAMVELQELSNVDRIAVIGGGIAGLTFTTAALKLGYSIDLYEKSHLLIPFQYGCETRRIHPHFYNWPEPLSEYPYCDLPFFSWNHDSASTIVKSIYDTFKNTSIQAGTKFNCYRGVRLSQEDIHWGIDESRIAFDSSNGQLEKNYTKIIVATGYGIEKRLDLTLDTKAKETTKTCISYWRNDDLEQTNLTKDSTTTYIISGTGDGALMDSFRLKLTGFTTNLMLEKLKENNANYKELKSELLSIRKKYESQTNDYKLSKNQFLYTEYERLKQSNVLIPLFNIVRNLERKDNIVILHHRQLSYKELFNLRRASMFNNLIAFALLEQSICRFKSVEFNISYAPWHNNNIFHTPDEIQLNTKIENNNNNELCKLLKAIKRKYPDSIHEENVKLILRHGTTVELPLQYLGINVTQINCIKEKQLKDLTINHLSSIWPPGWWTRKFLDKDEPIEFVEPELVLLCNAFISSLASVLELILMKSCKFRITLHRVIKKNDQSLFQQISNYFGKDDPKRLVKPVGRIFPLEIGIVGYSCKTGRSLLLQKLNHQEYEQTWNALTTNEQSRTENKYEEYSSNQFTSDQLRETKEIFTCPILFQNNTNQYPIFCLYIDSNKLNLKKPKITQLIYTLLEGFVNHIKRASEDKIIEFEDLSESLFVIDPEFKAKTFNKIIEQSSSLNVIDEFENHRNKLTFENITPHYITSDI